KMRHLREPRQCPSARRGERSLDVSCLRSPRLLAKLGISQPVFYSDAVGGVHRRPLFMAAANAQVLLRGTGRSGFHPGLNQRAGLLLRTGRGAAAGAGGPGPADQRIFADVMDKVFDLTSAIAGRV